MATTILRGTTVMLVTTLCWWLYNDDSFKDVSSGIIMLMTYFPMLVNFSLTCQSRHKHKPSPTSVTNIDVANLKKPRVCHFSNVDDRFERFCHQNPLTFTWRWLPTSQKCYQFLYFVANILDYILTSSWLSGVINILYFLFVINEVESLIKMDPYLLLFYFPLPELF